MTPWRDHPGMWVLEAIDGPYKGHVFRVKPGETIVDVRPQFDFEERPTARYRVVSIDGDSVLRHLPDAPDPDGAS
jgi:hypothetical protein